MTPKPEALDWLEVTLVSSDTTEPGRIDHAADVRRQLAIVRTMADEVERRLPDIAKSAATREQLREHLVQLEALLRT
jgi:hypothetical protein